MNGQVNQHTQYAVLNARRHIGTKKEGRMPTTIKDIKTAKVIGRKGDSKHGLITCPNCHNDRWVQIYQINAPNFTGICTHCSHKRQFQLPTFDFPIIRISSAKELGIHTRNNHGRYLLIECPSCRKQRWVQLSNAKRKRFSSICHTCTNKRLSLMKLNTTTSSPTVDIRNKIRLSLLGHKHKPESKIKMSQSKIGRKLPINTRLHMSSALKKRWENEDFKNKLKRKLKEVNNTPEAKLRHSRRAIKVMSNPQMRERISNKEREYWKNPEYRNRIVKLTMSAMAQRPNKPETLLNDILQKHFPNTWVYNGFAGGGVIINGLVPDFVNISGKNKVIEVFGDYFHDPTKRNLPYRKTEQGRIEELNNFGYDCLIIWEHELKQIDNVILRIKCFEES